jgi:hypothetical protein
MASILVYVHPVSAPAWGLAIWCALVLNPGQRLNIRRRLVWGGIAALAAAIIATPSLKDQLVPRIRKASAAKAQAQSGETDQQARAQQQEELLNISKARYSPGLMNLQEGFTLVWEDVLGKRHDHRGIALGVMLWALAGIGCGLTDRQGRRDLLLLLIALTAFAAITVLIPLLDSVRANAADRKPAWYDLARGIRFWPFWLLLLGGVGVGAFGRSTADRAAWKRVVWAMLPFVFVPMLLAAFWEPITDGAGRVFTADRKDTEKRSALDEVIAYIDRETPVDAAFVVPRGYFWLRHTPGRPVCHSWKEGTTLSYSYREATAWKARVQDESRFRALDRRLLQQQQRLSQQRKNGELTDQQFRQSWATLRQAKTALWQQKLDAWRTWGGQYALQPTWTKPGNSTAVVFENRYWFVARISETP